MWWWHRPYDQTLRLTPMSYLRSASPTGHHVQTHPMGMAQHDTNLVSVVRATSAAIGAPLIKRIAQPRGSPETACYSRYRPPPTATNPAKHTCSMAPPPCPTPSRRAAFLRCWRTSKATSTHPAKTPTCNPTVCDLFSAIAISNSLLFLYGNHIGQVQYKKSSIRIAMWHGTSRCWQMCY